jgi:hypothetical protein
MERWYQGRRRASDDDGDATVSLEGTGDMMMNSPEEDGLSDGLVSVGAIMTNVLEEK